MKITTMEKSVNETLMRNVNLLSKLTEQEVSMMPQTQAPLPLVEQVKHIITLIKILLMYRSIMSHPLKKLP